MKSSVTKPQDLTETCISSETLVKGKLLHAKRDKVRLPNGVERQCTGPAGSGGDAAEAHGDLQLRHSQQPAIGFAR